MCQKFRFVQKLVFVLNMVKNPYDWVNHHRYILAQLSFLKRKAMFKKSRYILSNITDQIFSFNVSFGVCYLVAEANFNSQTSKETQIFN